MKGREEGQQERGGEESRNCHTKHLPDTLPMTHTECLSAFLMTESHDLIPNDKIMSTLLFFFRKWSPREAGVEYRRKLSQMYFPGKIKTEENVPWNST